MQRFKTCMRQGCEAVRVAARQKLLRTSCEHSFISERQSKTDDRAICIIPSFDDCDEADDDVDDEDYDELIDSKDYEILNDESGGATSLSFTKRNIKTDHCVQETPSTQTDSIAHVSLDCSTNKGLALSVQYDSNMLGSQLNLFDSTQSNSKAHLEDLSGNDSNLIAEASEKACRENEVMVESFEKNTNANNCLMMKDYVSTSDQSKCLTSISQKVSNSEADCRDGRSEHKSNPHVEQLQENKIVSDATEQDLCTSPRRSFLKNPSSNAEWIKLAASIEHDYPVAINESFSESQRGGKMNLSRTQMEGCSDALLLLLQDAHGDINQMWLCDCELTETGTVQKRALSRSARRRAAKKEKTLKLSAPPTVVSENRSQINKGLIDREEIPIEEALLNFNTELSGLCDGENAVNIKDRQSDPSRVVKSEGLSSSCKKRSDFFTPSHSSSDSKDDLASDVKAACESYVKSISKAESGCGSANDCINQRLELRSTSERSSNVDLCTSPSSNVYSDDANCEQQKQSTEYTVVLQLVGDGNDPIYSCNSDDMYAQSIDWDSRDQIGELLRQLVQCNEEGNRNNEAMQQKKARLCNESLAQLLKKFNEILVVSEKIFALGCAVGKSEVYGSCITKHPARGMPYLSFMLTKQYKCVDKACSSISYLFDVLSNASYKVLADDMYRIYRVECRKISACHQQNKLGANFFQMFITIYKIELNPVDLSTGSKRYTVCVKEAKLSCDGSRSLNCDQSQNNRHYVVDGACRTGEDNTDGGVKEKEFGGLAMGSEARLYNLSNNNLHMLCKRLCKCNKMCSCNRLCCYDKVCPTTTLIRFMLKKEPHGNDVIFRVCKLFLSWIEPLETNLLELDKIVESMTGQFDTIPSMAQHRHALQSVVEARRRAHKTFYNLRLHVDMLISRKWFVHDEEQGECLRVTSETYQAAETLIEKILQAARLSRSWVNSTATAALTTLSKPAAGKGDRAFGDSAPKDKRCKISYKLAPKSLDNIQIKTGFRFSRSDSLNAAKPLAEYCVDKMEMLRAETEILLMSHREKCEYFLGSADDGLLTILTGCVDDKSESEKTKAENMSAFVHILLLLLLNKSERLWQLSKSLFWIACKTEEIIRGRRPEEINVKHVAEIFQNITLRRDKIFAAKLKMKCLTQRLFNAPSGINRASERSFVEEFHSIACSVYDTSVKCISVLCYFYEILTRFPVHFYHHGSCHSIKHSATVSVDLSRCETLLNKALYAPGFVTTTDIQKFATTLQTAVEDGYEMRGTPSNYSHVDLPIDIFRCGEDADRWSCWNDSSTSDCDSSDGDTDQSIQRNDVSGSESSETGQYDIGNKTMSENVERVHDIESNTNRDIRETDTLLPVDDEGNDVTTGLLGCRSIYSSNYFTHMMCMKHCLHGYLFDSTKLFRLCREIGKGEGSVGLELNDLVLPLIGSVDDITKLHDEMLALVCVKLNNSDEYRDVLGKLLLIKNDLKLKAERLRCCALNNRIPHFVDAEQPIQLQGYNWFVEFVDACTQFELISGWIQDLFNLYSLTKLWLESKLPSQDQPRVNKNSKHNNLIRSNIRKSGYCEAAGKLSQPTELKVNDSGEGTDTVDVGVSMGDGAAHREASLVKSEIDRRCKEKRRDSDYQQQQQLSNVKKSMELEQDSCDGSIIEISLWNIVSAWQKFVFAVKESSQNRDPVTNFITVRAFREKWIEPFFKCCDECRLFEEEFKKIHNWLLQNAEYASLVVGCERCGRETGVAMGDELEELGRIMSNISDKEVNTADILKLCRRYFKVKKHLRSFIKLARDNAEFLNECKTSGHSAKSFALSYRPCQLSAVAASKERLVRKFAALCALLKSAENSFNEICELSWNDNIGAFEMAWNNNNGAFEQLVHTDGNTSDEIKKFEKSVKETTDVSVTKTSHGIDVMYHFDEYSIQGVKGKKGPAFNPIAANTTKRKNQTIDEDNDEKSKHDKGQKQKPPQKPKQLYGKFHTVTKKQQAKLKREEAKASKVDDDEGESDGTELRPSRDTRPGPGSELGSKQRGRGAPASTARRADHHHNTDTKERRKLKK